jgi:hypothetical protein
MIELSVEAIFFFGWLLSADTLAADGEQGYVDSGKFFGVGVS